MGQGIGYSGCIEARVSEVNDHRGYRYPEILKKQQQSRAVLTTRARDNSGRSEYKPKIGETALKVRLQESASR